MSVTLRLSATKPLLSQIIPKICMVLGAKNTFNIPSNIASMAREIGISHTNFTLLNCNLKISTWKNIYAKELINLTWNLKGIENRIVNTSAENLHFIRLKIHILGPNSALELSTQKYYILSTKFRTLLKLSGYRIAKEAKNCNFYDEDLIKKNK